jgi:hypothetical protein
MEYSIISSVRLDSAGVQYTHSRIVLQPLSRGVLARLQSMHLRASRMPTGSF